MKPDDQVLRRHRMAANVPKIIAWVGGIAMVAYLASFLIYGVWFFHLRRRTVERIRQGDHAALLSACRSLMENGHTFTNDPVVTWARSWQASVARDSEQYNRSMPPAIKDLTPKWVRITTNQVYLYFWDVPRRMCVRAFATNAHQFGTEKLVDGLWLVTREGD